MPSRRSLPLLIALTVLPAGVSACGSSNDDPPAAEGTTARVEVVEIYRPQFPYGEEGSLSFATIERDGVTVAQAEGVQPNIEGITPLIDEHLEGGSYHVTSYKRTCGPSGCSPDQDLDDLDPPAARCSAALDVRGREPIDVVIRINPNEGSCEIETGFGVD